MTLRIYCLLGILCSVLTGYCQNLPGNIRPLSIGDTIPADLELTNVYNYPVSKIRLSDLKGKLVILDFWATWCANCIHNFPLLDSFSTKIGGRLQVLLVNSKATGDQQQKIRSFFSKRKSLYNLPYIAEDTILSAMFPAKTIPHYVWLYQNRVFAITTSSEITQPNIMAVLNEENVYLKQKRDVEPNLDEPFPFDDKNNTALFRSQLSSYRDGLGGMTGRYEQNNTLRIWATNNYVLSLYNLIYPELMYLPRSQVMLNVREPAAYSGQGLDWERSKKSYTWCYELMLPTSMQQKADQIIKQDLDAFFDLNTYKETCNMKCLALVVNSNIYKAKTKGGLPDNTINEKKIKKQLINQPVSALVEELNKILPLPVLDHTDLNYNIDIDLPSDITDINSLRARLAEYGIEMNEIYCDREVFIVNENN